MRLLLIAVVAAVVGLGVGLAGANLMKDETKTASETAAAPETTKKAADLRVLLNAIEREHVDLAAAATRNGFDGDPAFKASADQLDKNSVALADAVGSVYGQEARDSFLEIWRSHIGFFVDYTVAAKNGDEAGMTKAVENLNGYVESVSEFLSGANPENLPKEAVKMLVSEHVTLLKGAVDAHAKGNYAESFTQQHAANEQIGTIADTLSGAIVKQYPDKF